MVSSSPLPPHSLVEVGLQIFSSQPLFLFLPEFKLAPARLHLLCMHSSAWIDEIVGVHDNSMSADAWKLHYSSVCPPIVCMDFTTGQDASIDDR